MGINIDYLNELVLKNILSLEKQVDVFFDLIRKNYFMKSKLDRIEKLKKVIKETDNSATNLLNTVELSGMDPQLFRKRFETLQSKKQKLEKELKKGLQFYSFIPHKSTIISRQTNLPSVGSYRYRENRYFLLCAQVDPF